MKDAFFYSPFSILYPPPSIRFSCAIGKEFMKPVIVMPMFDPAGLFFPLLQRITPQLKKIFGQAYISIPQPTREAQAQHMAWLQGDDFFQTLYHQDEVTVGEDFLALYNYAAQSCHPDQILHLGYIDRVAFAIQSDFQQAFVNDVVTVEAKDTPLLFQRSKAAWNTHPQNYFELEQIVTQVGEILFGKCLDFAWCYLIVQARQLQEILPFIKNRDISMVAEVPLLLKDTIHTREVDWLAWEDPFIYARNSHQLKQEREQSLQETRKRLRYVIPMLQLLEAAIDNQ